MTTTANQLIAQLESAEEQLRLEAARQLAQSDNVPDEAAIGLIRLIGSGNESIREWAVEALEKCSPGSSFDFSSLNPFLISGSCDDQCWHTLKLISRGGSDAQGLFPQALSCCSEERTSNVRVQALKTASKIAGSKNEQELRTTLQTALTSSDPKVAFIAERLLSEA